MTKKDKNKVKFLFVTEISYCGHV